jgi:hypothetical protein
VAFFLGQKPGKPEGSARYLVPPLAGVPAGVTPAFDFAALASGVGVGLVPMELLLELDGDVEELEEPLVEELVLLSVLAGGVEELLLEGVVEEGVDGVAPVSSTFLPQAPSASKAAKATAVAAAGLNWDASMLVFLYEKVSESVNG